MLRSLRLRLKNIVDGIMPVIEELTGSPVVIEDPAGRVVYGREAEGPGQPVEYDGQPLCRVRGAKAPLVAALFAHLARLEGEKRSLGRETLEKYKELTMLYSLTEQMAAGLTREEIGRLVVEETGRLVSWAGHVSVLMPNGETGRLETIAASGPDICPDQGFSAEEGLTGGVWRSGRGEIVNDVRRDPRATGEPAEVRSLLCVPLKVKDKVTGVIRVVSTKPVEYGAGDLKLLTTLAFQAAVAMENASLAFIRETFGRFLSDEVVRRLVDGREGLKLGGGKVTVTIMMTDLRGFTQLSESLPPEGVVAVINNYLKEMVEIIQKYHGTVLEFVGDAIMVVFGAPLPVGDHASLALACAIEMQSAMHGVNGWNRTNGYPEIEMGVGINTGQVIAGNIGSEKRTKYGCVGNEVNVAARIESCTLGGQVLVSAATLRSSRVQVKVRDRKEIHPKGLRSPLTIYDVGGLGAPYHLDLPAGEPELVELSEELPVRIMLIEENQYTGEVLSGRLRKVSRRAAQIFTAGTIPDLAALKIEILSPGDRSVLAEVQAKAQSGPGSCLARFTAVSPSCRRFLDALTAAEWENIAGGIQDAQNPHC